MTTPSVSFEQGLKKLGAQQLGFLFETLSGFAKLHDQARFSNWAVPKASEARRKFVFVAFLLLNNPHWPVQYVQERLAEVGERSKKLGVPEITSFREQSSWHSDAPVPYLTDKDLAYYNSIATKYAHLLPKERLLFARAMHRPKKIASKVDITLSALTTRKEKQIA